MNCPICKGDTIVVDSRVRDDYVYRRRKCLSCDLNFTTHETYAKDYTKPKAFIKQRGKNEN